MVVFICFVEVQTPAGFFRKGYRVKARNEGDARADAEERALGNGEGKILSSVAMAEDLIEAL